MMFLRKSTPRIIAIALTSRAVVFFCQLLFNLCVPDHVSVDAFAVNRVRQLSALDKAVDYIFSGLNHWDAQHFIHITEKGYDSEDKLVFLPLFPMSLRIPAHLIHISSADLINSQSAIIISAFILNTCFFILASIALYELTFVLFGECKFAEESVMWFAFNPASIFFSATYSESLFSLFTFTGLWFLEKNNPLSSGLMFGFSAMTRSNGLVNAGYLFYFVIRITKDWSGSYGCGRKIILSCEAIMGFVFAVTPFFYYQMIYIVSNYCPGSSFCTAQAQQSPIPKLPYIHLQEKYWNQGFLRFWKLNQLPNFLIALPIICLVLWSCFVYSSRLRDMLSNAKITVGESKFWSHPRLVPYVVHVIFLVLYASFCMHIQVFVRLICSSSPWLYWMSSALETNTKRHTFVKYIFTFYFFSGIALFANALPFT